MASEVLAFLYTLLRLAIASDSMSSIAAVLSASVTTFAATNVDDILLLTLYFARRTPVRNIIAGQYLGFLAIILISCVGLLITLAIPHTWIRVLGLIPLFLGLKQLAARFRQDKEEEPATYKPGTLSIALVTLSNGADNIGVYVPFLSVNRSRLWVILMVYAVLVAVWCAAGRWLGKHPLVSSTVNRAGHILVPVVFICLGIWILIL